MNIFHIFQDIKRRNHIYCGPTLPDFIQTKYFAQPFILIICQTYYPNHSSNKLFGLFTSQVIGLFAILFTDYFSNCSIEHFKTIFRINYLCYLLDYCQIDYSEQLFRPVPLLIYLGHSINYIKLFKLICPTYIPNILPHYCSYYLLAL